MYWRLTNTLTACIVSNRVLFLDVARDRYFAMPPALDEPFGSWLAAGSGEQPPNCCHDVLSELMTVDPAAVAGLTPLAYAVAMPRPFDAESIPPARIQMRDLLRVGRSVISAWRDLRSRPLAAVLAQRLQKPRSSTDDDFEDLKSRLAVFRTVRPFIPVPRICLPDCLALIDWLGPDHARAQLVFGVSAFPFAAHSWVQADGMQIDDHPESPSRFQPILHFQ